MYCTIMADKKAAAALVAAQFEPLVAERYQGVDNPTAKIVTTYRTRHNIVIDPKLKAINKCMRDQLAGKSFKVGTKVENIKEQRGAFRRARAACRS